MRVSRGFVVAAALCAVAGTLQSGHAQSAQSPVANTEQAAAGAALYAAKCTGPPLKGDYFWTTWGGQSARKLYGMIISTMPANDPGSLSQADSLALAAFILRANGYPPGQAALTQPADLQDLTIQRPGG